MGKGWGEKRLKTFPDGRFTGGFAPPMAVVALGTRPTPFIALNRLVGVASAGWPPAAPAPMPHRESRAVSNASGVQGKPRRQRADLRTLFSLLS